MPRKVFVSPAMVRWLQDNHASRPLNELAAYVGCCVDTLKRVLVREGLAEFDGAKFAPKRDFGAKLWTRPCLRCKDTTPRAKNLYLCDRCRSIEEPYY